MRVNKYILIIIFIGILILAAALRFLPYLVHNHFFEIGFDTGYYEQIFLKYAYADNWGKLPAYPDMPYVQAHQLEPGLFIAFVPVLEYSAMDIHSFFRYVMPAISGILISTGVFLVIWKYTEENVYLSLFGATLAAISFVQIDAVNASYYRQIMAIFVFLVILWRFDSFRTADRKGLSFILILGAGLFSIHRPMFVLFVALIIINFLSTVRKRDRKTIKTMGIALLLIGCLSAPFWLPTIEYQWHTILDIATNSINGIKNQLDSGYNQQGGGVPDTFTRNAVILSYIQYYLLLSVFALIGSFISIKDEKRRPIILISSLLLVSLIFWFSFGNRMLLIFDIMVIVSSTWCIGWFIKKYVSRWKSLINSRLVYALIITILLMVPSIIIIDYQAERRPLIVKNIEGVEWMEMNIDKCSSIIFTTDRLSVSFVQKGFEVANLDWTLSRNYSHPMVITQYFITNSPGNSSYLIDFFQTYHQYYNLDIYVIWGESDEINPLNYINEFIPTQQYVNSSWYTVEYTGHDEIAHIYKFNHSSFSSRA